MRPHIRAVIKFLRQVGAQNVRIEHDGKHPRCYYRWLDKESFYVLPNSPGDTYRCQHNVISDLRRKLGGGAEITSKLSAGKNR
jgi:hypothetical protein